MKILIAIMSLTLFTNCSSLTKVPCSDTSSVANKAGRFVAESWECQRADLVIMDFETWMGNHNWCQADSAGNRPVGPIASVACPFLTNEGQKWLAGQIPDSWKCNTALVGKNFAAGFQGICNLIPF